MKELIVTTALAVSLACPVAAAPNCASKEAMWEILAGRYQEIRRIGGHSGFNDILELWANEETGTWTVVKIRADGIHCIVDQGTLFYEFSPDATPEGDPA